MTTISTPALALLPGQAAAWLDAPGLRQACEFDDADKAERLLRNIARRLDQEAPAVAATIPEGLGEMLTVNRVGLPLLLSELQRLP